MEEKHIDELLPICNQLLENMSIIETDTKDIKQRYVKAKTDLVQLDEESKQLKTQIAAQNDIIQKQKQYIDELERRLAQCNKQIKSLEDTASTAETTIRELLENRTADLELKLARCDKHIKMMEGTVNMAESTVRTLLDKGKEDLERYTKDQIHSIKAKCDEAVTYIAENVAGKLTEETPAQKEETEDKEELQETPDTVPDIPEPLVVESDEPIKGNIASLLKERKNKKEPLIVVRYNWTNDYCFAISEVDLEADKCEGIAFSGGKIHRSRTYPARFIYHEYQGPSKDKILKSLKENGISRTVVHRPKSTNK